MTLLTPTSLPIINARGTFTPLGVSRSSKGVAAAVAAALQDFAVIELLHAQTGARLAAWAGCEAAAVTHCTAASVTLAVAAAMTGQDAARIQQLPDTTGLSNAVILPVGHAVDYGHPLLTDIRLAGGRPVVCGSLAACSTQELAAAVAGDEVACLMMVASRLTKGPPASVADLAAAVSIAHEHGVPAIIDGAAQDWRVQDLLDTGADAVLVSAQKYLAGPTAGLVLGTRAMVDAVRAQERGIGRAMKTTKEALAGVQAAVAERVGLSATAWRAEQDLKVTRALGLLETQDPSGIIATSVADASGLPFSRIRLDVDGPRAGITADQLARALRDGTPSVWAQDHDTARGAIWLELVALRDDEIVALIQAVCSAVRHR